MVYGRNFWRYGNTGDGDAEVRGTVGHGFKFA